MYTVKKYIESGVLELYVLNALSLQEKQEVEAMLHQHKALSDEIEKIKSALDAYKNLMEAKTRHRKLTRKHWKKKTWMQKQGSLLYRKRLYSNKAMMILSA